MRVPVPVAWLMLLLTLFTCGLLRQFHDRTPISPFVHPVVGSLLFAALFFLLLVAAREWRRGAVPGHGVRLGSLTPLLLMLVVEKWISLTLYHPLFYALAPDDDPPALADARFRALAGLGLLATCLLIARFSVPTMRKTWRRARPLRWPAAALSGLVVLAGTYLLLGGLSVVLGGGLSLYWPKADRLWAWVFLGQALLAFAEELYYRGLVLSELERLMPRLGLRPAALRRWGALGLMALLFGMEHVRIEQGADQVYRQLVFTISLALLFGVLVLVSANLHFAAAIHAWINWLLLGAAPYFVDGSGRPALPSGSYIGLTLILAFVLAYLMQRFRHGRRAQPLPGSPGDSPAARSASSRPCRTM